MGSRITPFTPEHGLAVAAFNQRLALAGVPWRFPETAAPDWLPRRDGVPVWQEYYLLVEDNGTVHGAHALKRQEGAFFGRRRRIGSFYWPISEGAIDPAHAMVATRLLRAAIAKEPLLFIIGIPAADTQIARLIRGFGWQITPVPLYFKPLHPSRFLRRVRYLRDRTTVARLLDLGAVTGIGWLGLTLAQAGARRLARRDRHVHAEAIASFGPPADQIWAASARAYSFLGGRDAVALNATFPPERTSFTRLEVRRGADTVGWVVVEEAPGTTADHFGELRVGTIVDALALPEHAGAVIQAATEALIETGVDLIISNQSHPAWRRALGAAGFIRGPSSWGFAAAPAFTRLIETLDPGGRAVHLNRGDGDGPWGMALDHPDVSSFSPVRSLGTYGSASPGREFSY